MDWSKLTREQAERIVELYRQGYACSAVAREMSEELGIKERDIDYRTGYTLTRESYRLLEYLRPPNNED